jgi:hypothetical protein
MAEWRKAYARNKRMKLLKYHSALQYLRGLETVYRDLKPVNIGFDIGRGKSEAPDRVSGQSHNALLLLLLTAQLYQAF